MTIQEARQILSAYRPDGEDAADPFFAEALEMTRINPELGAWLQEKQDFDDTMRKALRSEIPPAGLREELLTKQTGFVASTNKTLFPLRLVASLVAAIICLAGIVVFHEASRSGVSDHELTMASFTKQALDIKEQGVSLGMKSTDPEQLRHWLAERGAPAGFVVPPGLRGLPAVGCQSYSVHGTKISLVCFNLGNSQIAHLFIVDKKALADAPPDARLQLREEKGIPVASWSGEGKSYVLTGDHVSMETLKRLV
jgi:hypothetical protein